MQSSFYLGINQLWNELLVMQKPGLYWVNVDGQGDAAVLCRQTLGRQVFDAKAAFIAIGDDPNTIISTASPLNLQRLPLFSLVSSRQAIFQLPEDLMRSLKPQNSLLVLYSPSSLWRGLTVSELIKWLSNISDWLKRQNSTLLLFCYGQDHGVLHPHLKAQHRALSGLSTLSRENSELKYEVDFWCNELGVLAGERLNVILDSQGLRGDTQNNAAAPKFISDEDLYLAVRGVLSNGLPPADNWHLFSNNEELTAAALQVRASTIIFVLEKRDQIDSLLHQIYSLRRQRGNGLKIAVRAITPNLRFNDEYALKASGANIVVNFTVPFDNFLAELASMQGEIFSRYIPDDVTSLVKAVKPLPLRGYVNNETFSRSVISLINNALLPEDNKGVLLSFLPAAGLTARQALTLCRVRRDGDLITLFNGKLVLFLSSCKVNELNSTLRFIFKLPVEQAFRERSVWYRDRDILLKMSQLQEQASTEPDDLSNINDIITHQDTDPAGGENKSASSLVRIPEAITLRVGGNQESPL